MSDDIARMTLTAVADAISRRKLSSLEVTRSALTRIDRLQPAAKSLLVKALVLTIAHDGRMTVSESELLRAICAVLHCPLPPLYVAAGQ